jgi:tRNA threonylcarbamoyl adenosine modification protein YeaZ
MKILAFDTSSPQISVAVADDGRILSKIDEFGNASVSLLPSIEKALKNAGLELRDIEAFAIGEGPGSYNGLRCGFATLQGILLAHPRPVIQLNSLPTMLPASRNGKRFAGVVLDARKKVFFYQKFNIELEVPVQFQEGMSESIESIPEIDASDGVWYSYDVHAMKLSYPDAATLAQWATLALKDPDFETKLGEPRYLRPPV